MEKLFSLFLLVAIIALRVQGDISIEIPVLGIEGRSVNMLCDLPTSNPPEVKWIDWVFNQDKHPLTIFTSQENPQFQITESHPNKDNFVVNPDFSLTISNLNMEEGTSTIGRYICTSTVDGEERSLTYYLNVHCTCKSEFN